MVKLLKLTEANLNRISKGHEKDGYAILSASRHYYSEQENNLRAKKLVSKLRSKHYSYIPVYGGYKEYGAEKPSIEKSFIVYPYDIHSHEQLDWDTFEQDMIDLGIEFEQDSILICRPNSKPYYKGLKSEVKDSECYSNVTLNDVTKDYFTAIKKWSDMSLNRKNHSWENGNPQRFTFESFEDEDLVPELYIDPYPGSMSLGHARWAQYDMNHVYLPFEEYRNMFNDDSFVDLEE